MPGIIDDLDVIAAVGDGPDAFRAIAANCGRGELAIRVAPRVWGGASGFELRVDTKLFPYPQRYTDKRGEGLWQRLMELSRVAGPRDPPHSRDPVP